ncbi:MAG TPA: DUF5985 family protein [Humisphaera sp.]
MTAAASQFVLTNQFLLGAVVAACLAAGLFFLRFWRRTRDRLFAAFAVAFWVLGLNWAALAWLQVTRPEQPDEIDEVRTVLYVVRLLAFVLILAAIIDKNRARRPT